MEIQVSASAVIGGKRAAANEYLAGGAHYIDAIAGPRQTGGDPSANLDPIGINVAAALIVQRETSRSHRRPYVYRRATLSVKCNGLNTVVPTGGMCGVPDLS